MGSARSILNTEHTRPSFYKGVLRPKLTSLLLQGGQQGQWMILEEALMELAKHQHKCQLAGEAGLAVLLGWHICELLKVYCLGRSACWQRRRLGRSCFGWQMFGRTLVTPRCASMLPSIGDHLLLFSAPMHLHATCRQAMHTQHTARAASVRAASCRPAHLLVSVPHVLLIVPPVVLPVVPQTSRPCTSTRSRRRTACLVSWQKWRPQKRAQNRCDWAPVCGPPGHRCAVIMPSGLR